MPSHNLVCDVIAQGGGIVGKRDRNHRAEVDLESDLAHPVLTADKQCIATKDAP